MQISPKFTTLKYFTILSRIFSQLFLYHQIKQNTINFSTFCSPPIAPVSQNFLLKIILISFIPYVARFYKKINKSNVQVQRKMKWISKLFFRVLLLLIIKIITFADYQNLNLIMKIQSLMLQIVIFFISIGFDFFNFYGIQVAELLLIDFFLMAVYIFQLTHHFCFKFGFFNFGINLIVVCISIIQGYEFRSISKKVNTIFTKQDGQRILVFTNIYFIFFSIGNLRNFGMKYFIITIFTLPFLILSTKYFKKGQFQKSLYYIVIFEFIYLSCAYLFENS